MVSWVSLTVTPQRMMRSFVWTVLGVPVGVSAVTVYTTLLGATPSGSVDQVIPTYLPVPAPPPPGPTDIVVQPGSANDRLSKPHRADFIGISIELSISDRLIGTNATWVNPIFLNFVQNIRARSGKVPIRLGGNTQDASAIFPSLALGNVTIKKDRDPSAHLRATNPPLVSYTEDLFHAMASISSLVQAEWYIGLPFLNTTYIPAVAQAAQDILGSNLVGLQLGNEPDVYPSHQLQFQNLTVQQYLIEFGNRLAMVPGPKDNIFGPSVCCSWTPDEVIQAGFLTQFGGNLKSFSVQHYAENGCDSTNPPSTPNPQALFNQLLNHTAATSFAAAYVNASQAVQAAGKEIIMLESNSVSCGGLDGVSDTFGSALFAIDNALQLASISFSQVFFHSGGGGAKYSAFTVPPGNRTNFRQWTVGSTFYSILAISEAIGHSGNVQVADLNLGAGSASAMYTPGYTIVESGTPVKVALFNFISDATGASNYNAVVTVPAGQEQVRVKYLYAESVSSKQNITWANQTLGQTFYASDGRLQNQLDIVTVPCSNGSCRVPMRAPSFALVYLSDHELNEITPTGAAAKTFATTVTTRRYGQVFVDPSLLATSNGDGGAQELLKAKWQATSEISGAVRASVSFVGLGGFVAGALITFLGSVSG
ncbi:putative glycoside hydrolase family 79 protein [Rhizoctonia solani 123E]|uniref:Putative glycoside hydrolase family 79 protein n=1 Tax=Rhizoctonia solani 123E TaxID=1423351 RepID=A0A074RYA6_9AGAM|nr:putative glycoside hydrolase family 79 protein [Rhizoctonia solani 123E]